MPNNGAEDVAGEREMCMVEVAAKARGANGVRAPRMVKAQAAVRVTARFRRTCIYSVLLSKWG